MMEELSYRLDPTVEELFELKSVSSFMGNDGLSLSGGGSVMFGLVERVRKAVRQDRSGGEDSRRILAALEAYEGGLAAVSETDTPFYALRDRGVETDGSMSDLPTSDSIFMSAKRGEVLLVNHGGRYVVGGTVSRFRPDEIDNGVMWSVSTDVEAPRDPSMIQKYFRGHLQRWESSSGAWAWEAPNGRDFGVRTVGSQVSGSRHDQQGFCGVHQVRFGEDERAPLGFPERPDGVNEAFLVGELSFYRSLVSTLDDQDGEPPVLKIDSNGTWFSAQGRELGS
jgi:hypothetical protein